VEHETDLTPARRKAALNEAAFLGSTQSWDKTWVKQFKEKYGYDPVEAINQAGFTLARAARQLSEKYKLAEAVTQDQMYALAIGLVRTDISSAYRTVPTVYRQLAMILPSTKAEESYFPLFEGDVPTPVQDTEALPEDRAGGIQSRIRNYKFGKIKAFSNMAADDDQTGALRRWGQGGGEKMAYAEEQWWAARFLYAYVAGSIRSAGGIIPSMCVAGQASATYGGPACTAGAVTRDNLLNLFTAADYVTDASDNLALVEVNAGLFANADKPTVNMLLNSKKNPNTTSASANVTPGTYAANPLYGLFAPFFSRFLTRLGGTNALSGSGNPWALGEAGKMGAFQERSPLQVSVESPVSGPSWEADITRVKYLRRFGAGVVAPEFALRGN